MSVIVQMPDGKIKLYCKGAVSCFIFCFHQGEIPFSGQHHHQSSAEWWSISRTNVETSRRFRARWTPDFVFCVSRFDSRRIRSLLGIWQTNERKILSRIQSWSNEYKQALLNIGQRDAETARLAEKIERNLTLLGATGIEDKLQEVFFSIGKKLILFFDGSFSRKFLKVFKCF